MKKYKYNKKNTDKIWNKNIHMNIYANYNTYIFILVSLIYIKG